MSFFFNGSLNLLPFFLKKKAGIDMEDLCRSEIPHSTLLA
jgi:hypothetical protein